MSKVIKRVFLWVTAFIILFSMIGSYQASAMVSGIWFMATDSTETVNLKGAEFALMQGDEVIDTCTSDVEGEVHFYGIAPGTYTLKETVAPAGYEKSEETHTVVVMENSNIKVDNSSANSFNGYKYKHKKKSNTLSFKKTNEKGDGLSGAVFGLYDGDTVVYTGTSGADGTVIFNNIAPGTYTLKEKAAPTGYELSKQTYPVVVSEDMDITVNDQSSASFASYEFQNKRKSNSISFKKTNESGDGLSGAIFGLYDGDTVVYSATSASDGTVIFSNILPGTYTLKEKTAPSGYELSDETHAVVVSEDMSIKIDSKAVSEFNGYAFVNTSIQVKSVTLPNIDVSITGGRGILNAAQTFNLFVFDHCVFGADAQGLVAVGGDMTASAFSVNDRNSTKENAALYVRGNATFLGGNITGNLVLNSDKTNSISNTTSVSGQVVYKTTADFPINFESIESTLKSNSQYLASFANTGTVVKGEWNEGYYTLTDMTSDVAVFNIDSKKIAQITIKVKEGATVIINVTGASDNKYDMSSGVITVNGYAGNSDDGAAYNILWNFPDASEVYVHGYTVFGSVLAPYANFKGEGGNLNGTLVAKSYDNLGGFEFHMHPYEGETPTSNSFSFKKTNGDGTKRLPGAVFGLFDGNTAVYTATSTADGTVTFKNIAQGTYTLKEITAPTGYDVSQETHSVVVASNGSIKIDNQEASKFTSYKFINTKKTNKFSFKKTDESGNGLAGATFILKQGGETKYTATSNANGIVEFTDLAPGTYLLIETVAPNGYQLSGERHNVKVADDLRIMVDSIITSEDFESYEYVNKANINNSFSFKKTNAKGTVNLSGAEFGLFIGNELKYSATSDGNGTVTFTDIASGTYTLKEKTAPTGYEKSGQEFTVVVNGNTITIGGKSVSEFASYQYKNNRTPNSFSFVKTNEDGSKTLSGAEFGLFIGDDLKYSAISGADGVVTFSNIEPGTYTLQETKAPTGYEKSDESLIVEVADDMSIKVNYPSTRCACLYQFKNTKKDNKFSFQKTNEDGTVGLKGAEFGLYNGNTLVYSAISGADGTVTFSNIAPGTYTLKEKKAPTGYKLSTKEYTVVVANDMSIKIDDKAASEFTKFTNERIPNSFMFLKTNEDGSKTLSGAEFGLFIGDDLKYSATSAADGTVTFENIEPGTYTLKETKAPTGYKLSDEEHQVVVADDMSIQLDFPTYATRCVVLYQFKNTKKDNGFSFKKTNEDGKKNLSGAVFGLYNGDTLVVKATSDANGTVTFKNIEPGTYTLKEITAPTGYVVNLKEKHTVVVADDMSIKIDDKAASEFAGYQFKNTRKQNSFSFKKTNEDGTKNLSGAVFGLYNGDTLVVKVTSDANGTVTFKNIEPGTYTLKEISAPTGYVKSDETHTVVVAEDMSIKIDNKAASEFAGYQVKNTRKQNGFSFKKTNKDGTKNLSGAVFGLYNGDTLVVKATSDANGTVTFKNIEPGTYTLKEITAPTGYVKSNETHSVVVAEDMSIKIDNKAASEFTKVTNQRIPNSFSFVKTNEDGSKTLSGAEFGLFIGDDLKYSAISGADGTVTFENIEPGTYTLKETKAPIGYKLSEQKFTVNVSEDMKITVNFPTSRCISLYKFKNTRKQNSFSFKKTNEDGKKNLSGAVFGLYSGDTLIDSATSAADGTVTFKNIEPGTYVLKEITAPTGYVKSDEEHKVVVAEDMSIKINDKAASEFAGYQVKNKRKPNSFSFKKTNEDGSKTLSGAEFGLFIGDDLKYSAASAADGTVTFENIEPGTYTLKETKAPIGYKLSEQKFTVKVSEDMSLSVDFPASRCVCLYKFKNTRKQNGFSFKKTNEEGTKNLNGAVFGLYDGDTLVVKATSEANGTVTFKNIEPGTYVLKEISAPTGYVKSDEEHKVVVAEDMSIKINDKAASEFAGYQVKNKRKPNSFSFKKTNEDGSKTLSGAEFGLFIGDDLKYSAASAADGTVTFENIEPGTYTLKETKAPTGYKLSTKEYTVVVANDMSIKIDDKAASEFTKITNQRTPNSFSFVKTNEDGKETLKGAEFGLFIGDELKYSATSATNGTVTFKNIEPGTYTLKETKAPIGYQLSGQTFTVNVSEDMKITVNFPASRCVSLYKFKNTRLPNEFSFLKTDGNWNGITGAVFGLYDGDTLIASATSAEYGVVTFKNIEPGTYTLKEKTAAVGYQLSSETHTVVVAQDMSITIDGKSTNYFAEYQYVNEKTPNGFTFTKTNADGTKGLSGATFGLYDGDTLVYSAISGADGTVTFSNVEIGTYTLKEVAAAVGYQLSTETHTVVVANDRSITINGNASSSFTGYKFKNTRLPNEFSFLKTDGNWNGITGAVFGLYDGDTLIASATSAEYGVVTFKNIEPGTYTLKEITAAVGYQLSSETHTVVVAEDMSITIDGKSTNYFAEYQYVNEKTPNGFTFTKTNADGTKGLSGATFGLYDGDTLVYSAISGADGTVTFSNVEIGTYTLKEVAAAVGYQLSTETHTVVVANDRSITINGNASSEFAGYKFKNTRLPNEFSFLKTDGNWNGITGAVFGLYDGDTLIASATSAEYGVVTFKNIEPGTYTLKEITAAVGYQLSSETHTVVVAQDMSITIDGKSTNYFAEYQYVNEKTPNGFTFTKTNADGTKGLSGATFGLYNGDTLVYNAVSGADGTVTFSNVEIGTYVLKEIKAPLGYELSGETHTVTVADDRSITIDGEDATEFSGYKFVNERSKNSLSFIKVDEKGNGLAGAVFGLYDGDTLVYQATSQVDGTVLFSNIAPGTYTLKEITAPTGYEKSDEEHTIVVAEDMSITVDGNEASSFASYEFKNSKVPNIPKTGEDYNMNLILGLGLMMLGAMMMLMKKKNISNS